LFCLVFDCFVGMPTRYWCHHCRRSVRLERSGRMECPICDGDFLEEMGGGFEERFRHPRWMAMGGGGDESVAAFYENFEMDGGMGMSRGMMMPPRVHRRRRPDHHHHHHHHHMQMVEAVHALMSHLHRPRDAESSRRRIQQLRERIPPPMMTSSDHMLLLRGPVDGGVELFIPRNRASYTLDEFMEHLSQQFPDGGRCGPPPASRSAVDAMPTVKIAEKHLCIESHCAVCTDEFEIGGEAREMPCKHIYHADCILPWLAQHNSCPICRHEMPTDDESYDRQSTRSPTEQESSTSQSQEPSASQSHVGLTIWGLPGGGYAVGRFSTPPPVGRSSSSSSMIFNRGPGGSDSGNNTSGESQGRRNPFSFLWPFRSSNSSQEGASTSTNDHHARRWFG